MDTVASAEARPGQSPSQDKKPRKNSDKLMLLLAGFFMMTSVSLLIALIPAISILSSGDEARFIPIDLVFWEIERADVEVVMILFTLAGGLFGAAVRAGLEAIKSEDEQATITVQLIHSMLGVMASFLMYAVIRGGVMGNGTTAADLQPFTLLVLATAASVGGAAYLKKITRNGLGDGE